MLSASYANLRVQLIHVTLTLFWHPDGSFDLHKASSIQLVNPEVAVSLRLFPSIWTDPDRLIQFFVHNLAPNEIKLLSYSLVHLC